MALNVAQKKEKLLTGEELAQMPNMASAELAKGEIVSKVPTGDRHGELEALIAFFLLSYVRKHKLDRVMTGEVGIYTGFNPDTVRAADVAFMSTSRSKQLPHKRDGFLRIAPDLVIEIMSPHDRWSDINTKISEYFGVNVRQVWIVDPQLQQIHQYRSARDVLILGNSDLLDANAIIPGFMLSIADLFER